uniref:Uncharacterized protein n=1 Tax=Opuntia streptacantha TaxID=393608 RepID=A0A7C8ZKJ0_OPUST
MSSFCCKAFKLSTDSSSDSISCDTGDCTSDPHGFSLDSEDVSSSTATVSTLGAEGSAFEGIHLNLADIKVTATVRTSVPAVVLRVLANGYSLLDPFEGLVS